MLPHEDKEYLASRKLLFQVVDDGLYIEYVGPNEWLSDMNSIEAFVFIQLIQLSEGA